MKKEKHCHSTFADFQDWYEANSKPFDPTEWAKVEFEVSDSLNSEKYKLYIDGNIKAHGNLKEKINEPVYLTQGKHRIIFKEYETQKENRKESNTLYLDLEASSKTKISLSRNEDKLEIKEKNE